ncbi:MAG: polysaccharide biosynthesis/export family protein [Acidobacteriota bacterium]|nr:polysaccharide biosynthesis/export family protein [Acidobacteriota bacterium]
MKPRLSLLLVVLSVLFGASRVVGQPKPENPRVPPQAADVTNPPRPSSTPSVGAAVDPNKYIIGAEDILQILVWREPDLTRVVAVRPDGKITMPLIQEIQAADLTPEQLKKGLIEALLKYINNPDVTVMVQEVRSKKYYIDGEVGRPGLYPLVTPTTVLEALSSAGGFKEFANQKKIRILRHGALLKFNYKEVTNGKHMEQNVYLENGDHIIVH